MSTGQMHAPGAALRRVEKALERLGANRASNGSWQCPGHHDTHPSLSVSQSDGRVLIYCHKGCSIEDVLEPLELRTEQLFDDYRPNGRSTGSPSPSRTVVARYGYEDQSGKVLSTKARYEPKAFSWDRGNPHVLYRLPEILKSEVVYLNEGEKAADGLSRVLPAGHAATCAPTTRWEQAYTDCLRGKKVIVIADRDEAGLKQARGAHASLKAAGIETLLVYPAVLVSKADAYDHIEAGHGYHGFLHVPEASPDEVLGELGEQVGDWEMPLDFRSPSLPQFPIDALPQAIRDAVEAVSASVGNPPDIAAQIAIGMISFAVSRLVSVEIKPGHIETTNLQVGVIAPPGGGKTPTLRAFEKPLRTWQTETRQLLTPKVVTAQAVYDAKDAAIDAELKKTSTIKDDVQREIAQSIAAEKKGRLAVEIRPALPRWITSDFSMAGLAMQMPAAGGRMISINDEGTVLFNALLGKHSSNNSSEIGFFATLYNGGGYDESRAGREGVNLEEARLAVALTIQPEIFRKLKGMQELRDQGVLDRFVWSIADVSMSPADSPGIPASAMKGYEDVLALLLDLEAFDPRRSTSSQGGLGLDREAREVRSAWINQLIQRVADGDLEAYRGAIAKLRANVERLAGILHMVKNPNIQAYTVPISADTMAAATRVGDYWLGHMIGLHTMLGVAPGISVAERILRWIKRRRKNGLLAQGSFSQRDIFQGLKGHGGSIQKVGDLGEGLSVLKEHFFLREFPDGKTVKYIINPLTFDEQGDT